MEGYVQADLWGDHLRCWCISTNRNFYFAQIWFDGHVKDGAMTGSLWVSQGKDTREVQWIGRRDKVDFTGTWEWPGPTGSLVQLKIERHEGRLVATYADTNRTALVYLEKSKPIPVTDLYDFGGGFYFTLLLGLEGNNMTSGSRRAGPKDGWLVGEGTMSDNTLGGTIAFYPYPQSLSNGPGAPPAKKAAVQEGRHDWLPKRVAP
jgi:hypothetical protein